MPFGLCNVTSTFQALMNEFFLPHLYVFAVVCLDDILVYSNNCKDKLFHTGQVLTRLRQYNLYFKASMCILFQVKKNL